MDKWKRQSSKKTKNKLWQWSFLFLLVVSVKLLLFWAVARVTPVHYATKAFNSSLSTLQRSPWGGSHYPPSPADNTLPIMPLFNPIPPGMDRRGFEWGWEEMCVCMCWNGTVWGCVCTTSCPMVLGGGLQLFRQQFAIKDCKLFI